MTRKRVLLVGAGGFAGGFIAEEGLRRGYEMWAGVRESTSRKYLADPNLNFITFDFENPETLQQTLSSALPENERWEWIVYNLGATKALTFSDFSKINYDYLRNFLDALKKSGKVPEKLLFISSLSVMGPGDEKEYTPFTETMIPRPNTRYGASKLKAEMLLAMEGIPYIVFRCTGIYGPRDKDYFLMLKSLKKGVDFSVGFRKQILSFIFVEDLAKAVFDALENAPTGDTYNISEDVFYTQKEFRKIAAKGLGKKWIFPVRCPLWLVKIVSVVAEKWGIARMKPSTLNSDKFNILKQRNWAVDTSKAKGAFGFKANTNLKDGLNKAIDWYKKEGWL